MQFTSKFILLAIALAYGGTAVSAVPVRESSLAAREIDDMELFVRDPFSLFGFARGTTSPVTDVSLSVSPIRNS